MERLEFVADNQGEEGKTVKDEEKQIIVNEINKWREGRLLPSEYCDFLLNLYSEGERSGIPEPVEVETKPKTSIMKRVKRTAVIVFVMLAMVCLALFAANYSSLSGAVQVAALSGIVFLAYIATIVYKYRGNQPIVLSLLHSIASIMLAITFIHATNVTNLVGYTDILLGGFAGVFLVWIVTALWMKHKLVFMAGLAGFSVLYYKVVSSYIDGQTVFHYQVYWVPLFLIALWFSLGCNLKPERRQYGLIFLLTGVVYLFMPEVAYFLQNVSSESFQYVIPIKLLIVIAGFIFGMNYIKQHTEQKQMEV